MCNESGTVCPVCRGARLVAGNRAEHRIQTKYEPCSCMVPDMDPNTGRQRQNVDKRLLFRLDTQREIDNILRYRDMARRDELVLVHD